MYEEEKEEDVYGEEDVNKEEEEDDQQVVVVEEDAERNLLDETLMKRQDHLPGQGSRNRGNSSPGLN